MSDIKIFARTIEDSARKQIDLIASQSAFSDAKIRIMPDCHSGAGCVIGFTADLREKVIPDIVGVDIGCGILVTQIESPCFDFAALDNFIKNQIPCGFQVNDKKVRDFDLASLKCFDRLENKEDWIGRSLGSLGGGNHFIEIDKGENNSYYLVIHSGSRNLGKQIAQTYQYQAYKDCSLGNGKEEMIRKTIAQYKKEGREKEIQEAVKDIASSFLDPSSLPFELCYMTGKHREEYLHDMKLTQIWAQANRLLIADSIIKAMGYKTLARFESVHNYIGNDNIVRKGAISAYKGEKVIIPLNMKDGSIIGSGKGNPDWNYSAPHGAGRLMSRRAAMKNLRVNDFVEAMKGIYTSTAGKETIDEAPMAYKDPKEIEALIAPTVDILEVIKPVYNFKAGS